MDDKILEKLNSEISHLIDELSTLEPGSEKYGCVQQDLVNLIDRREKMLATINTAKDLELKERREVTDCAQKRSEAEAVKKDRLIGYMIDGVKAVGTLGFCFFMAVAGFKFEETGSYTSNTFREGRNNMFKMISRK